MDSCFVLVRTHQHGIAIQPQAKSCFQAELPPHACGSLVGVCQTSTVAPVTCIVVTWVTPVVRMRVGSGQTVELSSGGLSFLPFYFKLTTSTFVLSILDVNCLKLENMFKDFNVE